MSAPKIRFKKDDGSDYPAWGKYTVSDAFSKIRNKNKDCLNDNVITNSAEFGLVKQRDFFDKDIANEGNTANYTIIQQGDFVYNPRKSSFAPMGPFNRYNLADEGIVSPLYICLKPKDVFDADFLLWYFQTNKWYRYISDNGAQNGARHDRVGMNDSIMMGIPITAPCREEQQKIAEFLSDVDELINASEDEITKLTALKKGMLQKMFPKHGEKVPEIRFPGFTGDWEQQKLGEIAEIKDSARIPNDEWTNSGVPYIRASDVSNDDTSGNIFITKERYEYYKVRTGAPQKYDVLFNGGGEIGKAILKKDNLPVYVQGGAVLYVKTSESDYIKGEFLVPYFSTKSAKQYIEIASAGGTMKHFTLKPAQNMLVSFPCIEEQSKIGTYFSNLDNLIALHQQERDKYKELKKGLLQQMFI